MKTFALLGLAAALAAPAFAQSATSGVGLQLQPGAFTIINGGQSQALQGGTWGPVIYPPGVTNSPAMTQGAVVFQITNAGNAPNFKVGLKLSPSFPPNGPTLRYIPGGGQLIDVNTQQPSTVGGIPAADSGPAVVSGAATPVTTITTTTGGVNNAYGTFNYFLNQYNWDVTYPAGGPSGGAANYQYAVTATLTALP